VQLGAGGAGRAVAVYLADAGARLTLSVREPDKISDFAQAIGASTVAWDNRADTLGGGSGSGRQHHKHRRDCGGFGGSNAPG